MTRVRVPLGQIAEIIRGVTYDKATSSRESKSGFSPLLRATNISDDGLDFDDPVFVPDALIKDEQRLRVGDVVIAASSGSLSVVGKAALLNLPFRGTFGAFCYVVRPNPHFALPEFITYFMRSSEYRQTVSSLAAGININNLRREHIENIAFPLIGLDEQRRAIAVIDSAFSRLAAAMASLRNAIAKLKAYRASVLKAAIEGRLVPTEAELARAENRDYEPADVLLKRILIERRRRWEEAQHASLTTSAKAPTNNKWKAKYEEPSGPATTRLPQLPQGWCWATVDQVGEVLLGRQRAPQYLTGRYSRAYLRVANIKDDRIELDDLEEMDFNPTHFSKYQLQPGDILVSEGQSPHLCGQSAIYKGGVDGLCFQKTLHRFRPVMGGPSSEFAQIVFRANVRLGVYKAVASITTNIAHLTLEKFKESRFPLPPLREQERISMEVQRLLSVVDAQENQVSLEQKRLARLRQSILKWAFEGRLVDQDPRDEPADRLLERIRAQRSSPSVKKGKSRTQLSLL